MSTSVIKKQTFPILELSENIVAPKSTEIMGSNTLTLPPGTWLICGLMDWNKSFDGIANYKIKVGNSYDKTVRSSGWNGGGVSHVVILTLTASQTLSQGVYQAFLDTATARARLTAVKLF